MRSCSRWCGRPCTRGCTVRTGSRCSAARSTAASGESAKRSSAAGFARPGPETQNARRRMPLRRPGPGACLSHSKLIEVLVLARCVPLRRSAPPRRKTPIRPGRPPDRRAPVRKARGRPWRGPQRSADYLAWIRTLGCVVCSRASTSQIAIEAAHTNALGPRGLSQKSSDYSAIPLAQVTIGRMGIPTTVWVRCALRNGIGSTCRSWLEV